MKVLVLVVLVLGLAPIARADGELPDPSERLLRWPLSASEHPNLAPRYNVAKDLAEPGLDWLELCKIGAHKRTVPGLKDQTAYLGAWCAIANNEVDTGVMGLLRLKSSAVRGLPAAIRVDLSNVLANEGGDRARYLIAKHRIRDLAVMDRLAALFFDMNKRDAAREINDMSIDVHDPSANRCMRQGRRVAMDPDSYRGPRIADERVIHGAACTALDAEVRCWLDWSRCATYFGGQGRNRLQTVFVAYRDLITHRYPGMTATLMTTIDKLKTPEDISLAATMLATIVESFCDSGVRSTARVKASELSQRKLPEELKERLVEVYSTRGACVQ